MYPMQMFEFALNKSGIWWHQIKLQMSFPMIDHFVDFQGLSTKKKIIKACLLAIHIAIVMNVKKNSIELWSIVCNIKPLYKKHATI